MKLCSNCTSGSRWQLTKQSLLNRVARDSSKVIPSRLQLCKGTNNVEVSCKIGVKYCCNAMLGDLKMNNQ